jgi:hypothetical protein
MFLRTTLPASVILVSYHLSFPRNDFPYNQERKLVDPYKIKKDHRYQQQNRTTMNDYTSINISTRTITDFEMGCRNSYRI